MPDALPKWDGDRLWTPTSTLPPTRAERLFAENRAAFAAVAKYPVRPPAALSEAALAAIRARLGSASVRLPVKAPARVGVDRTPLSGERLRAARVEAGYGVAPVEAAQS